MLRNADWYLPTFRKSLPVPPSTVKLVTESQNVGTYQTTLHILRIAMVSMHNNFGG